MNIHAYKFDTVVSENGTIQIPELKNMVNQEIEIFVIVKNPPQKQKHMTASEFINKWAGFISTDDVDDLKFQYLNEKYK
jgi:hypothetical protein